MGEIVRMLIWEARKKAERSTLSVGTKGATRGELRSAMQLNESPRSKACKNGIQDGLMILAEPSVLLCSFHRKMGDIVAKKQRLRSGIRIG
jgi:hypothetical protein